MVIPCRKTFLAALLALSSALCLLPMLSGCASSDNSNLGIKALLDHFSANGIKITEIGLLRADAAHAEFGMTATIEGRQIGIYKYDLTKKRQREFLERIQERGFFGIAGHKFEADNFAVNGTFIMIDFKDNPKGKQLLELFKDF